MFLFRSRNFFLGHSVECYFYQRQVYYLVFFVHLYEMCVTIDIILYIAYCFRCKSNWFMCICSIQYSRNLESRKKFILQALNHRSIAAGSALVQGSLFGLGSLFPSSYMGAIMKGQAIGGVVAAIANIATLAASSGPLTSALAYFIVAQVIMVACLLAFFVMQRLVRTLKGLALIHLMDNLFRNTFVTTCCMAHLILPLYQ